MNILKNITWFLANAAFNAFFGLLIAALVYSIVEVSETALWSALAIGQFAGWIISTTCGWAAIFTSPVFWVWMIVSEI